MKNSIYQNRGMRLFLLICIMTLSNFLSASNVDSNIASLESLAFHPERSAPATAQSFNNTIISSQIQAKVQTIRVNASDMVKAGDILIEMDCTDYVLAEKMVDAKVRGATSSLNLAEQKHNRNKDLSAKKLTSLEHLETLKTDVDIMRVDLEEKKISLSKSKLNVSRCTIKAPFDGVITEKIVSEGQLASYGTSLLTLIETKRIELSAKVNPEDASLFHMVDKFFFNYGESLSVNIKSLGGVVDPLTRSQEARFTFGEIKPLPGTAGKLLWRDPRAFIPPEYIVRWKDQYGLFISDGGVAEFLPISDVVPGRSVPVNLPKETLIVTKKLDSIQPGDKL